MSYLPSVSCGYIWDDDHYIEMNPTLQNAEGFKTIWWPFDKPYSFPITVQYYPVTYTSFWLESWLWGRAPMGYHVVNILLHALGSILLWRVLNHLQVPGSWLIAVVFGVHPVHVESVSWITERKNVLSGVFYLISLLSFLKFSFPQKGQRSSSIHYMLSLVFYSFALLAKSVTCTLPAVLLLIEWWKKKAVSKQIAFFLAPYFVLGLGLGLLTVWMEEHQAGAMGKDWDLSFVDRILIAGRALWFYIFKLIYPVNLSFIYERWEIDSSQWQQYIFPLTFIAVIFLFWFKRTIWGKGPLVALLYFAGTLFPALGFFNVYPMRFSFVADHFQYLASIGIISFVVVSSSRLLNFFQLASLGKILGGVVILVLSFLTWNQQSQYKNRETLWLETTQKNPKSWLAHVNYSSELQRRGQLKEAVVHAEKALALKPNYIPALNSLASIYVSSKQFDKARYYANRSIQIGKPSQDFPYIAETFLTPYNVLADVERLQGNHEGAKKYYQLVLEHMPHNVRAQISLGNILFLENNFSAALSHYQQVLLYNPRNYEVLNNIGNVHKKNKNYEEAKKFYLKAIQIVPSGVIAHYNLAGILEEKNKLAEALHHYGLVLQHDAQAPMAAKAREKVKELRLRLK